MQETQITLSASLLTADRSLLTDFMLEKKHRVHFIGIGGIGMSGIAEVLLNSGYAVTGSDLPKQENDDLQQFEVVANELKKNVDFLENNPKIKEFIGPGLVQRPGTIADILTQLGMSPKEFATFKADVDKTFQKIGRAHV